MIGLFSLRVRAIFFAMITLAVASAFATLASQLSDITGGEDGLTFKVPEALQPGTEYASGPVLGAILVAMTANYVAFLAPTVAPASSILLMVAVLMWRPQGLYPVAKR